MFVMDGARRQLLKGERQRFLDEEWPQVLATINRLGLEPEELLQSTNVAASPTLATPRRSSEE